MSLAARACGAAVALALLAPAPAAPAPTPRASASAGAAAAPELAAYRAYVAGDSAAALLALARSGLVAAASDDAGEPPPHGPAWPGSPRPLYVTLMRGRLIRACVGSDTPLDASLGGSVWKLAARALTADRRRAPVRGDELDSLRIVLAFAGDDTPVADPYAVHPLREGLKLETARGGIAFLPGEARTIAWALAEARRAGVLVGPVSEARCSRFPVVVIQESVAPPGRSREGAVP